MKVHLHEFFPIEKLRRKKNLQCTDGNVRIHDLLVCIYTHLFIYLHTHMYTHPHNGMYEQGEWMVVQRLHSQLVVSLHRSLTLPFQSWMMVTSTIGRRCNPIDRMRPISAMAKEETLKIATLKRKLKIKTKTKQKIGSNSSGGGGSGNQNDAPLRFRQWTQAESESVPRVSNCAGLQCISGGSGAVMCTHTNRTGTRRRKGRCCDTPRSADDCWTHPRNRRCSTHSRRSRCARRSRSWRCRFSGRCTRTRSSPVLAARRSPPACKSPDSIDTHRAPTAAARSSTPASLQEQTYPLRTRTHNNNNNNNNVCHYIPRWVHRLMKVMTLMKLRMQDPQWTENGSCVSWTSSALGWRRERGGEIASMRCVCGGPRCEKL